jgi:hypothetical protein
MCHVGQEPDSSRTLDARIALLILLLLQVHMLCTPVVQQSRPITFYQWVYVVQIVTQRTEMYLQNFSLKRTNGVKWVNTVQHFA